MPVLPLDPKLFPLGYVKPPANSGPSQHFVPVMHQRGFSEKQPEGGRRKQPLKRNEILTFVYLHPSSPCKWPQPRIKLANNFTSLYTYDFKDIPVLQADKGVITKEESAFELLFEAARSEEGPSYDPELWAELIVHYFRRLLVAANSKLKAQLHEKWKQQVNQLTTESLGALTGFLLDTSRSAYEIAPTSALKGQIVLPLLWQSLVAQAKGDSRELPALDNREIQTMVGPNTAELMASFLKMAGIQALWEGPLKGHPQVEDLLSSFNFSVELNPNEATPFILTDNPLAYIGMDGTVFQLCPAAYLEEIDQILLPLSSTCLLRAIRKSVGMQPVLPVETVNKWLAQTATERYIAPIENYSSWMREAGTATLMPYTLAAQIDAVRSSTEDMGKDIDKLLKTVHANSTAEERRLLEVAQIPPDASLMGAPTEWPKSVPPEVGLKGADCWFRIHFSKENGRFKRSLCRWRLQTDFRCFVHADRKLELWVAVPATPEMKDMHTVCTTYWNAVPAISKRLVIREPINMFFSLPEIKAGRVLLYSNSQIYGSSGTGHALIMVEGKAVNGEVIVRKYIWVTFL